MWWDAVYNNHLDLALCPWLCHHLSRPFSSVYNLFFMPFNSLIWFPDLVPPQQANQNQNSSFCVSSLSMFLSWYLAASTLEKEMATHSSILAWRIPWTDEPGGLHTVHGVTKSRTRLSNFTITASGWASSGAWPLGAPYPIPSRAASWLHVLVIHWWACALM